MNRRTFVAAVLGSAFADPAFVLAQMTLPVIGFLSSRSPEESTPHVNAFRKGLSEEGFIEGRNVTIEYRWARGRYQRLPAFASELVALNVNAMVAAGGAPSALAAKAATTTIPIIFVTGDDPVRLGIVASFNRPGGNLTGVSFFTNELGGKRFELLCELVPNVSTVGLLVNPNDPGAEPQTRDVQRAADTSGRKLLVLRASKESELDASFATLNRERVRALVVHNDPFFDSQRDRLITLAAHNSIPAIYHIREFPAAGGLMSYGASLVDAYRQVGIYTARILKGEKPSDLPVTRPTKFELVINLKTAKALGITIPQSLLLRADEVVQ